MEFTQFMAILATILGVLSTVIGLVNSKSKSDKADAVQINTLELLLKNAIKDIEEIKSNVKSISSDSRKAIEQIVEHSTRLKSLEARVKKIEEEVEKSLNDGK